VVHGPELGDDPVALEERMEVTDVKVGPSEGVSSKLVDKAVSSELCAEVNDSVSHDDCVTELDNDFWLALAGVVFDVVVDMEVATDTAVDIAVITVLVGTCTDVLNGPELGHDCVDDTALGVPVLSQLPEVLLEPVCATNELPLVTVEVLMAIDAGTVEPVWIEAEDDPVLGSTDTVEESVGPAEGTVVMDA
jgi:hypothetical protein